MGRLIRYENLYFSGRAVPIVAFLFEGFSKHAGKEGYRIGGRFFLMSCTVENLNDVFVDLLLLRCWMDIGIYELKSRESSCEN